MNEKLVRQTSKFNFSPYSPSIPTPPSLSFSSSIEASFLRFLSRALSWWWSFFFHGLFSSGWRLLSPFLLYLLFQFHGWKSPLKDLIEAQRSSLHRSFSSKLPSISPLLELEDFELDRLLLDDAHIPTATVGILPMEFASHDRLTTTLKGDVLANEEEWTSLAEDLDAEKGIAKLCKPQADQARHLKLLYIKAMINGRPINQAFVDNDTFHNVMSYSTIKKPRHTSLRK